MAENIKVIIRERRAQVEGGPVIVCGNSDYTITFDFDSDWNLTGPKTARFVYVKGGEVLHEDKVFSGKTVAVPVLSDVSFVDVGVFAGDLCTTTPARIRCKRSILCGSGEVHEPTPDVYAQIMALFNEMAEQGAFGATEAQAQQIEANKQNIAKLTNGTTPAGKATDAAQLGGETALQWQGKIDSIQTGSSAELSQAGWYRIAEYSGSNAYVIKGSAANGCTIVIKRNHTKTYNEMARILLDSVHGNQEFKLLSAKSRTQLIPKIRYTYNETEIKAYIEIYYNSDSADRVRTFITDGRTTNKEYWKAITPTLTEETVDGVTVTTTYDIPANASPVTSLDLQNIGLLSVGAYRITSENTLASLLDKRLSTFFTNWTDSTNFPFSYGSGVIIPTDDPNHNIIFYSKGSESDKFNVGSAKKVSGSWTVAWNETATTADLANYFPISGGEIDGNVRISSSGTTARYEKIENSARAISFGVTSSGAAYLQDDTNSKSIISSTADGTNTFNGTASGNLPLNLNSIQAEIKIGKWDRLKIVRNDSASNSYSSLVFANASGNLGGIGYDGNGNLIKISADGAEQNAKQILHTGNSAKVAIQSTAPTDGLWVW